MDEISKTCIPLLPAQEIVGENNSKKELIPAVQVKDATFLYNKEGDGFESVSIQVPQGVIYALLGPSGCGKTTLLKCVSGLLKVKIGHILILGRTTENIQISRLGYMPQELSLYDELTVTETIYYFGRLDLMHSERLTVRASFLLDLLVLGGVKHKLVKQLSGGQKRRVSLAAALVHNPQLLLLDEPTVGADPLLRRAIWEHLRILAGVNGTTIIITTHYIEEARGADYVAFMRKGRILLTGTPDYVMTSTREVTLERAFLKLCQDDDRTKRINTVTLNEQRQSEELEPLNCVGSVRFLGSQSLQKTEENLGLKDVEIGEFSGLVSNGYLEDTDSVSPKKDKDVIQSEPTSTEFVQISEIRDWNCTEDDPSNQNDNHQHIPSNVKKLYRIYSKEDKYKRLKISVHSFISIIITICWRNLCLLKRNKLFLLVVFGTPLTNVLIIKLCLGRPPFDLVVTVVNMEQPPRLSARFLEHLSHHTFSQIHMIDPEEAVDVVRRGEAWASLHIDSNFTDNLLAMTFLDEQPNNINRHLRLYADSTNLEIYRTIVSELLGSYQSFVEEQLIQLGLNPNTSKWPMVFEQPVFGDKKPEFADFTNVNILTDSMFITSMGLAAMTLVTEKSHWDRAKVTGLTPSHVVVAQVLLQSTIAISQVIVLCVYLILFQRYIVGSLWLAGLLCFLNSCMGMAIGFLISAISWTCFGALTIVVTVYQINAFGCDVFFVLFTMLMKSTGLLWPYESQSSWIRPLTSLFPEAFSVRAVREVLFKGWTLNNDPVWSAISVSLFWTLTPLVGAIVVFNRKITPKSSTAIIPKQDTIKKNYRT